MGKDSFRGEGIDQTFAEQFKNSRFYKDIYDKHRDEIILGVRNGYINLYYNCDSIAKIEVKKPTQCLISKYYTGDKEKLSEDEIVVLFERIKKQSDKREKKEKQAQQQLFLNNNCNPHSEWFCIDVEYTKPHQNWRFDIIAISKDAPFRIALIELKYGIGALQGKSGIRKHVRDYYAFFKNKSFKELIPELVSIINAQSLLGVNVPPSLMSVKCDDIAKKPEFYFVTLDNNAILPSENTPKQTMSGQLFRDKRWGCKRLSSLINRDGEYFDLIEHNHSFKPVFLFSKARLPELQIDDILDRKYYDEEII